MSIDISNLAVYPLRNSLITLLGQVRDNLSESIRGKWDVGAEKPSPVDNIVEMMEAGYSYLKSLPEEAPAEVAALIAPVVGRAAYFVSDNQLHGKTQRALDIFKACRRALGEDVSGEDPDPEA